jgi:release factor glutamine methyltransferase
MARVSVKISPLSEAEEAVLCGILKMTRAELLAQTEVHPTVAQLQKFVRAKVRLKRGVPLAYVLGYRWFSGLKLKVDEYVLIPRPETEQLVELAIRAVREGKLRAMVDVGTGSGAIAIAVKKSIGAKLTCTATDVSGGALRVARLNAKANKVKVKFAKGNLLAGSVLKALPREGLLITANLPYLTRGEMSEPTIAHEPKLALLGGGTDGTYLIKKLIAQIGKLNLSRSTVLLEIGYAQAAVLKAAALSEIKNCGVSVHKDAAGFDRILQITIR